MKRFKIIFLPDALEDIKASKKWYDKQQSGLGTKLIADVELSIKDVKQNPFFGSIKYMDIRTVSCLKFPYAIHYSIDEINRIIIVTSIFHLHRNPFWDKQDE